MTNIEKHLAQWRHNRRFAKTIPREFRDWQVNVIFYIAVHVVDAALAKLGVTVSNHSERNDKVRDNLAISSIKYAYMDLYRISIVTRYDAEPDDWIPKSYLTVNDLAEGLLKPIENGLGAIIGKQVKYEPLHLQS